FLNSLPFVDVMGAVIQNSSVTLASSRDRLATKTDERGRFSFSSVPPEKFHLQSIAPDFLQTDVEVDGIPGKDVDLGDIVLQGAVLRCPRIDIPSIMEVPSKSPE